MPLILGIHNGHHASCALVRDGALVCAIEQERITRRKADGSSGLSNNLPVLECLQLANVSLEDVDLIVSSFQAIGPGGAGLIQPVIEPGFELFAPFDHRHFTISHHYAHALCAIGTSGFHDCAILVSDLAGSTTIDGMDFSLSFSDYFNDVTTFVPGSNTLTECLSIYNADEYNVKLLHREYCVPHSAPEVFVYSPASLYENVSRMVFRKENAYGELMALASMVSTTNQSHDVLSEEIIDNSIPENLRFRNDWQHRTKFFDDILSYAPLAHATQDAFEIALLDYVKKTRSLTGSPRLAAAGGVFLNIVVNSKINASTLFDDYFVPSSPHDAGIAIGCAYYGWRKIAKKNQTTVTVTKSKASDRLGSVFDDTDILEAIQNRSDTTFCEGSVLESDVAKLLCDGKIVARFSGAAEFGPRALGGRSLLATPLLKKSKERLNLIKKRQPWRPVAPIVQFERISEFFEGPGDSPYMNMAHQILEQYRNDLAALKHPDGSARVQTLSECDDPYLYAILHHADLLTGYPIIVNTSFNGRNEPIVETPDQALDFLLINEEVDYLLLGDKLVHRVSNPSWQNTKLAQDVIVSTLGSGNYRRTILIRGDVLMEISKEALNILELLAVKDVDMSGVDHKISAELSRAVLKQFLIKQ